MLGLSACSFLTLTYVTLYSERKKLLIIWQDKLLNDLGHGLHCLWLWTYFLKALSLITATFSPGEPQACPGLLSAHTFWLFIYQIQYWGFFLPFCKCSHVSKANPFSCAVLPAGLRSRLPQYKADNWPRGAEEEERPLSLVLCLFIVVEIWELVARALSVEHLSLGLLSGAV